jgi:hypothetical protein
MRLETWVFGPRRFGILRIRARNFFAATPGRDCAARSSAITSSRTVVSIFTSDPLRKCRTSSGSLLRASLMGIFITVMYKKNTASPTGVFELRRGVSRFKAIGFTYVSVDLEWYSTGSTNAI